MDYGYIKLHRTALEHKLFQDDWLWRLWCWCLLKANHAPGTFRGSVIPRGSFVTGKMRAAEELGVTESKWWRGAQRLAGPEYACIHITANNKWTMVTVLNYDTYQDSKPPKPPLANNHRTTIEQPSKPIEEQQERKERKELGRGSGGERVPKQFDTPEVLASLDRFSDYFRQKFSGELFDAFMREETYQRAFREKWTPEEFLVNVSESICRGWHGVHSPREPAPKTNGGGRPPRSFPKTKFDHD